MCCEMNFSVVPLNKKSCAIRAVLDFEKLLLNFLPRLKPALMDLLATRKQL